MSTTLAVPESRLDLSQTTQRERASEAAELLKRARALGPLLRAHADQAERDRRLPGVVFDALAEAGLQRMFTPRSLGGLELDPVTAALAMEEVASHDSAAGWALQPGNTGAWTSCQLPAAGIEEIYGNSPSVLMAAAFHPPQRATRVEGGYLITGRGPLASNIHDAEWLLLTALIMEDGQPRMHQGIPVMVALTMRRQEAQILDTWHSLGMRATDSNDVAVNDVFVPDSRSYLLGVPFEPAPHYRGPLYRFPLIGIVSLNVATVTMAIARNAINELRELATTKTPFGSMKSLRERASVHITLARAEAQLRSARVLFYQTMADAWQHTLSGAVCSLEQRADLLLAAVHAVKSSVEVVDLMHGLAGTSGVYQRNKLERHLRDVHTLKQHGFASEGKLETVGQIYLGLPPEFMLVAL